MDLQGLKTTALRELAAQQAGYKKTVHKTKAAILAFLASCNLTTASNAEESLESRLQRLQKSKLIAYCAMYPDYKKSYDRKASSFHIEFLVKKNVDLSVSVDDIPESTRRLKQLMEKTKDELLAMLDGSDSLVRSDKEVIARMILANESSSTPDEILRKLTTKELRARAEKHPLYNADSFTSKADLIRFLTEHTGETVTTATTANEATTTATEAVSPAAPDEDETEAIVPIDVRQFMDDKPDREQLKEAIIKMLTCKSI
jgi:hypothetical protein